MGVPGDDQVMSLIGTAEFEFDLANPLFEQIQRLLDRITPAPLELEQIQAVPERPGVYVLHHLGPPVYVGKADDSTRLRLVRHRRTLMGRRNLEVDEMSFRCVTFAPTWNPFMPEKHLIRHYGTGRGDGWNGKGLGSNEPGINRGQTRLRTDSFHTKFPLRGDWVCESIAPGDYGALDLLRAIKDEVPFYFKFQGNKSQGEAEDRGRSEEARRIYETTRIRVERARMTARELLILVGSQLPGEWQATITPSHMLLYLEQGVRYPGMEVVWPRDPSIPPGEIPDSGERKGLDELPGDHVG